MELGKGIHTTAYYDILNHITTAVNSVFDVVTRKAVTEEQEKQQSKGLPKDVLTFRATVLGRNAAFLL